MFKKIVSMLLLGCMVFTCMPLGVVFAQSDEDYIRSIPIVEFVPTCNGEIHDYSKAKIISIDKDVALTTEASVLKSLVKEQRVVFFKDMSAEEVGDIIDNGGLYIASPESNSYIVGTSVFVENREVRLKDHYISYIDPHECDCPECTAHADAMEIKCSLSIGDYEERARTDYAKEVFSDNTRAGDFMPITNQMIQREHDVMHWWTKVASYNFIIGCYPHGVASINNEKRRVYDVIAWCELSPTKNVTVKNVNVTLGTKDANNYKVLHATKIQSQGSSTSYNLTTTGSFGGGIFTGGVEAGVSWSFSVGAFDCVNQFSDKNLKTWKMTTKDPIKGDSWTFAPGIRMYAMNYNAKKGHIFFEIEGKFGGTFLWNAWAYESGNECSFTIK